MSFCHPFSHEVISSYNASSDILAVVLQLRSPLKNTLPTRRRALVIRPEKKDDWLRSHALCTHGKQVILVQEVHAFT